MVMWQIRKPVDGPWQVPGDEAKTAELLVEVDVLHPLPDHHHITQQEGLHQGDAHGVHIHCCEFATVEDFFSRHNLKRLYRVIFLTGPP